MTVQKDRVFVRWRLRLSKGNKSFIMTSNYKYEFSYAIVTVKNALLSHCIVLYSALL